MEVQKLALCTPASSTEDKVKAIDSLKDKYSVHVWAEAFGIPRGTYYNRKKAEQSKTVYERNDERVKPIIKEIFTKSEYQLGKKPIKYLTYLSEIHVLQSFSAPGSPTQNPVCESFFARMKYEALYRKEYTDLAELESEVEKYIDYYNNQRLHRGLNFKTPSQIEEIFYSIVS